MAKKSKSTNKTKQGKERKKQRRVLGGGALLGTFAGGVVGKVVERLVVNEIEGFVRPYRAKYAKDKPADNGADDVAGRVLTVLTDGGCKAIPQLLTETGLGLSTLLHALHTLRDFRLINFAGEPGEETVEATRGGARAVTSMRKNHINEEAQKLLAS